MDLAFVNSADPDEMLLRGKLWHQEVNSQSKLVVIIGPVKQNYLA